MAKPKRTWWVRAIAAVLLALGGWVLYISSKQVERNRHIQEEVSALSAEAAKIRRENETLSEKIGYFSSDDFREQEAKKKLGMKKAEETVVVIKPKPDYEKTEASSAEGPRVLSGSDERRNIPNYKKWWDIFFGRGA